MHTEIVFSDSRRFKKSLSSVLSLAGKMAPGVIIRQEAKKLGLFFDNWSNSEKDFKGLVESVECIEKFYGQLKETGVPSFGQIAKLKAFIGLDLSGLTITLELAHALSEFENLVSLNLESCKFVDGVFQILGRKSNFLEVSFANTKFNDDHFRYFCGNLGIKKINLAGTRVSHPGFETLKSFSGLTGLNVSGTLFDDACLPILASLGHLASLDVSKTSISDCISDQLVRLQNLEFLSLNQTRITDAIADSVGALSNLESLDGSFTAVGDSLVEAVSKNKDLRELGLNGTRITDSGLKHLVNHRKLFGLYLAYTNISDLSCEYLSTLPMLHSLNLKKTGITDPGFQKIVSSEFGKFQYLDLTYTGISNEGWAPLSASLSLWATSIELKFRGTKISGNAFSSLKEEDGPYSVTELDLAHTEINIDQGTLAFVEPETLEILDLSFVKHVDFRALERFSNLKHLRLAGVKASCGLGCFGEMKDLVSLDVSGFGDKFLAFGNPKELTKLQVLKLGNFPPVELTPEQRLYRTVIGPGDDAYYDLDFHLDISEFGRCGRDWPNLKELSLINCGIGDKNIGRFAWLTWLRILDLSHNNITDEGLLSIRGLSNLESLNLSGTKIKGKTLDSLGCLANLSSLNLSQTPLVREGLGLLEKATNLEILDISSTRISDTCIPILLKMPSLRKIIAKCSKISPGGAQKLSECLPGCSVII
jgi:Leucine-rich repeat (LRR) protein